MRARFSAKVAVVAAFATLALAASALAYSLVYYEGYLYSYQNATGPRHTLSETSARNIGLSVESMCTSAIDAYTFELAGEPACVYGSTNSLAVHPYCRCRLRYGAANISGGYIRAREDY